MNIDYDKLLKKVESMSGADFEEAVGLAKMSGDNMLVPMVSPAVHLHIAAKALGVSADELRNGPIKEYAMVTGVIANFFVMDLYHQAKQETQQKKSEN